MANNAHKNYNKYRFSLKKLCVLTLCVFVSYLLFFFARDVESSQDYHNYLSWFLSASKAYDSNSLVVLKDPAFFYLSNLALQLNAGVNFVILILVSISIFSKVIFIKRYDTVIIGSFFFLYFCKIFFVLEMTQFRAAAAIGLSLLSFIYFSEKKYFKSFFILLLSLSVHLSAILILFSIPIVYLAKKTSHEKTLLTATTFSLLFAVVFPFKLEYFTFLPVVGERVVPYLENSGNIVSLSLLNSYLLIKVVLFLVYISWFLFKRDERVITIDRANLKLFFLLSAFGTYCFISFRFSDSIALRVSEFYLVFDLLFFSYLSKVFYRESRLYFRAVLFLLSLMFLYSSLKLLN